MKAYPFKFTITTFILTQVSLCAQDKLDEQVKFSGGGNNPLLQSFINQDKTWYQDARQAYHGGDLISADGPLQKLDWLLAYTLFQWTNHTPINPGAPDTPDDARYPYSNGKHLVETFCRDDQAWMQVIPELENYGSDNISYEGRLINAWLPIPALQWCGA